MCHSQLCLLHALRYQGHEPMVNHMMSVTGENCAFRVSVLLLMFPEGSSLVLGDCRKKKA